MAEPKYLGLDPPDPKHQWESPLLKYLGRPQYIPEARGTFEALVPDRYKRPAEPPKDPKDA